MRLLQKSERSGLSWVLTAALVLAAGPAGAFPGLVSQFGDEYPTAERLANCGTCHNSFTAGQGLNAYGKAYEGAGNFADIEGDDSDGDGETNLTEILTGLGFEPGWNCDNYETAANAPADLADFVDVNNVGCLLVTTTVTMPPTTVTTTSTTATMPPTTVTTTSTTVTMPTTTSSTTTTTVTSQNCSQPVSGGPAPTATDCLFILNAAVGVTTCSPECICAPGGELPVTATDALVCLNASVGIEVPLNCPC